MATPPEDAVALKRSLAAAAPPPDERDLQSQAATAAIESKGAGEQVSASVKAKVESQLDADFGDVRVHREPEIQRATRAMGARAFAHGKDIFLGEGERADDPGLMAHELTHVAQQGAARKKSLQAQVQVGESNSPAEAEADAVANRVTSNAPANTIIVDDDTSELQPGQIRRSAYLSSLENTIREAISSALGTLMALAGRSYIDRYINLYRGRSAAQLERAAQRYASGSGTPSANGYLRATAERIRHGVTVWRDTGQVPPEAASLAPGGDASTPPVQQRGGAAQRSVLEAPPEPHSVAHLQATIGEGTPLDGGTASRMSDAFEHPLGAVRIHTGPEAARMAESANARAFALGDNIVFGSGQYTPGTPEGDALLAHELAHVVQQDGVTDPRARRKRVAEGDAEGEGEADEAARGVLARLYGGAKSSVKGIASRLRSSGTTNLALQRCPQRPPQRPPITDAFVLGLQTKLTAGDKPGFFADITGLNGARAGDAAVRQGLGYFVADGHISWAEAFRAGVLLELGPQRSWPQLVQNYIEGVGNGTFSVSALGPVGAEALRQFCITQAGEAAEGTADITNVYRNRFNALWDAPAHAGLASTFDDTLDSKGPRNRRARAIFNVLYADAAIKNAYDTDTPARFREVCDTYAAPDGVNLIASPRLQALRATLNPPVVAATGTADAPYVALLGAVRPAAMALDGADRQEIERNHAWRLAVDNKVAGPSPAVTHTLRDDLWSVVRTTRPAVAPAPPPPVGGPAPPEPVPALNAASRAWLRGIRIAGPGANVQANTAAQDVTFQVTSSVPNPGLAVRRKVVVTPAAQVISGQDDETAWAAGSASVPHTVTVDPDAGGAANSTFTATLTMPPLPNADFAARNATATVEDKRQDWFINNIAEGASYVNENRSTVLNAGANVSYWGGQLPITVRPELPSNNPGLSIQMDGELKRAGAVVFNFPRKAFTRSGRSEQLGFHIMQEPSPPPAAPQPCELKVQFFAGAAGPAIKTLVVPFNAAAGPAVAAGADQALLTADTATLNQPPATAGSLLNHMTTNFPANSPEHRVALAVANGAIQVEAVIVRSDSAAWLTSKGRNPLTEVAYACGQVTDARTLIGQPGAAGWRWGAFPNHVFLNLTPVSQNPGNKRGMASMTGLLAHEGIHAADRPEPGAWGRYTTEFRAYWIMGVGAGQSTAPDPTMSGMGPKSQRARTIFEMLYNHPLYSSFTATNYDNNTDHFRERVDNYHAPDGINLALSGNLQQLRSEIESYTGSWFPIKRAMVAGKYAACTADEKREISNNRMWRDLVEEKFTIRAEAVSIKTILGIPQ